MTAVTADTSETRPVRLRSERYAHIRSTVDSVDNAGNMRQQTAHGRIRGEFGEPLPNEQIVSVSIPTLCNPEQWIWRTEDTHVTGHGSTAALGSTHNRYSTGTCDLVHSATLAQTAQTYDFSGLTAADNLTQSSSDLLESSSSYDSWGNVVESCAGGDLTTGNNARCLRFSTIEYDEAGQVPVSERVAVRRLGGGAFDFMTTVGDWDLGLGVLTQVTDPNGLATRMTYDGLGRMRSMTPPGSGNCAGDPLIRIDYQLADELGAPINLVTSETRLDCIDEIAYLQTSRALVDGLGRTRVALADAEDETTPTVASRWQRTGVTRFSKRGAVVEAFQPDLIAANTSLIATLSAPPASIPSTFAFYDAFGRPTAAVAEDGSTARTVYHALSSDVWDPNDLDPSSHDYGTPATERKDGHGRGIDQVLRNRQPGRSDIEHYRLFTDYRADGKVVQVTRAQTVLDRPRALETIVTRTGKPHQVSRQLFYDSAGRRLASTDPDTDSRSAGRTAANRTWRYLFNRVGDLAAVRDPRGCGQNFYYDHGGRPIAEHYVSCAEAQGGAETAEQNVPLGAIGLDVLTGGPSITADALYTFDAYPSWFPAEGFAGEGALPAGARDSSHVRGLATAVVDRGQRSVIGYNTRGLVIHTARQLAVIPDGAALGSASLSSPPALVTADASAASAVTYDTVHTYVRRATYD
ncbi:MAG TPA: RHS repeat domain-containing protein, partial [Polyangiales bacterium]|nr:RHS repeat domain-containing protein [Polyangiales bacterium]